MCEVSSLYLLLILQGSLQIDLFPKKSKYLKVTWHNFRSNKGLLYQYLYLIQMNLEVVQLSILTTIKNKIIPYLLIAFLFLSFLCSI